MQIKLTIDTVIVVKKKKKSCFLTLKFFLNFKILAHLAVCAFPT